MFGSRNEFPVSLDRQKAGVLAERLQQVSDGQSWFERDRFSVQFQLQGVTPVCPGKPSP